MAGNPDAKLGLAKARLMYLYGTGAPDPGIPCRNQKHLVEVSTVDPKTFSRHRQIWDQELETMARSAKDNPFGIALREESLVQHAEDVDFLRRQADQLKDEIDNVDEIQSRLESLVESISRSPGLLAGESDKLLRLLDSYFRHSMNRQKLLSLLLSVQSRWQDSSGVSGTLSAFEVAQKETAKRKAKQAGEEAQGANGSGPPANAGHAARGNTDLFQR